MGDDAKNCHDGMGAAQGTTEVDAMDRKLHLKLTEQRQKLKAMQHRVETMKRAQSLAKRRDDNDDRKETVLCMDLRCPSPICCSICCRRRLPLRPRRPSSMRMRPFPRRYYTRSRSVRSAH